MRANTGKARYTIICPNCTSQAVIRSSEQISSTTRKSWCVCPRPDCALSFTVISEVSNMFNYPINWKGQDLPRAANDEEVAELIDSVQKQENKLI